MANNRQRKKQQKYDPSLEDGKKKPVYSRVAIGDALYKYSGYPSNGLSPEKLARIFKEADAGNVVRQMELFEEMEEKDPHLSSQLQTRKLAVTGLDWEIQPATEEDRDKEIAEFVKVQLQELEGLEDILLDMLDAIGKGISISEIEWDVNHRGDYIINDIKWIHPKKIFWDSKTDEIKIRTKDYPNGISLPENKFILHEYKARSGHPSRAGVLRVVSWMYLFKNYSIKDWVAFCETYGIPLRLGKYDAAASEEDKKELTKALIQLGTDAAGIIPTTAEIEFIEAQKTSSAELFEKSARYFDEQQSKAVLGQTLTSDSGGSHAQSKTHDNVRHDLTVADSKSLAATIRKFIIKPLVEFNFGEGTGIPLFTFDCKKSEDSKESVEVLKILVCDLGLEVPVSHAYKKYSIPKPEDGEAVLKPPTQSAQLSSDTQEYSLSKTKNLKVNNQKVAMDQVDKMTNMAVKHSEKAFDKMIQPLFNLIDKATSLEAVREILSDKNELKKVYEDMNTGEIEDLVQQTTYLSYMIGRGSE